MSFSSTVSKVTYSGNGTTTAFSFPYLFIQNSHLTVVLVDAANTETTQVLDTDYTVTGAGVGAGGTVTMTTAPATGETLVIYRDVPYTQLTDYTTSDPFPAETHEQALDIGVMLAQQNKTILDRCAKLPVDFATMDDLPRPVAGYAVRWNGTATGLENYEVKPAIAATFLKDELAAHYATMATATADTTITLGQKCIIEDRDNGIFKVISGTGSANGFNIVAHDTLNLSFSLGMTGYISSIMFGAKPGVASQQHDALNKAIELSAGKFKLFIPCATDGSKDYRVESTVFMDRHDLNIEFTGGAYLKPLDENVLQPLIIGGRRIEVSDPSNLYIKNASVQRASFNGGTANIGIIYKELAQSTIENAESRLSRYNQQWNPSAGGNAYNNYYNLQSISGERNFWIEASASGYTNENTFIGGRAFGTSDLETQLYIGAGGLGTGHNRFIGMSLESSFGTQAIYDNGDANEFMQCRTENASGWAAGVAHVFGSGCQYPLIITSRIDYDYDPSAASDPKMQIINYKQGTFFETAINGVTTLRLRNKSSSAGSTLDTMSTRDNDDAYAWRAIRLIASESGTHDGGNNQATLTDSGASFTVNALVDAVLVNETDGSQGIITSNTATTITATMLGGIENDWDDGDVYKVYLLNGALTTSGKMRVRRSLHIEQSGWNFEPLRLGSNWLWVDSGKLYIKSGSAPTSGTDGTVVGTQT